MSKKKILIMDDEDLVRNTAKEMLECTGFEVDVAIEGGEAISKYKMAKQSGVPFHAIILDLSVPDGLGGRETIGELLKIDQGVKAVVSSGNTHDDVTTNFRNYGFSAVIGKPYDLAELHTTLNKIID